MDRLTSPEPFVYPAESHRRKHGPSGYSIYADYKDWLRDEFDFRCVYCLRRESWERRRAIWVVEHLLARKNRPDLTTTYGNLVLACTTCNSWKSADHIRNYRDAEPDEYRRWMGFPAELPDLANRSVKRNSKPAGARSCRFEQRRMGSLPVTY